MVYNTGETSEQLKAQYNPEGSILRKAQLRMLDMLDYIDRICKENDIPYSLDGGNVLGAVRHNGFIPWDDDVDIIVERKYFNKLCSLIINDDHIQYKLQNHNTDPGYFGCWAVLRDTRSRYIVDSYTHNIRKYQGLQIDIFPLDCGISPFVHDFCNKVYRNLVIKNLSRCRTLAEIMYRLLFHLIFPVLLWIGEKFGNRNRLMYPIGTNWDNVHDRASVYPTSPISFEGKIYNGPHETVSFLNSLYGNYMTLPSVDNRNWHKATYEIW